MKLYKLIEEILDATGNPISSELKKDGIIKSNVLAGKKRTPEESGFCLHNGNVNRFSQGNATQMFLTLAFVFFTIQKEWLLVINFFEDFVKWLFEIAIPNDDWTWKDKGIVGKLGGMYGTGKDENFKIQKTKTKGDKISYGSQVITPEQAKMIKLYKASDAAYIAKIWKNKDAIYDFVMSNLDKPEKIYLYFVENISGLGPAKSAFATQLIFGKFGCIDSINTIVYADRIKELSDQRDESGKIVKSGIFNDQGRTKSNKESTMGYLDFLKSLEDLYQQDITQTLWDDWCEIVEHKINFANQSGENGQIKVSFADGNSITLDPYKLSVGETKPTAELAKKTKYDLSGKGVSREHDSTLRNSKFDKYGINIKESFKQFFQEACWKNYKQVGMKKKGNKMVPNCIPKNKKKKSKK